MLASAIVLVSIAGMALAGPVPEGYSLAERDPEPRPVINLTEIANSLGIDQYLYKREQRLWAAWSHSSFETIAPPVSGGQNTIVQEAGFSIINPAGNAVYNIAACQDYTPCVYVDRGRRIVLDGIKCLGGQMIFGCHSDADLGLPQRCAVWRDTDSNLLDVRDANAKYFNNFLSTGYKGVCIVTWINGGGRTCPKDALQTKSPTCHVSPNSGVPGVP